jgi:hypothetical protein
MGTLAGVATTSAFARLWESSSNSVTADSESCRASDQNKHRNEIMNTVKNCPVVAGWYNNHATYG